MYVKPFKPVPADTWIFNQYILALFTLSTTVVQRQAEIISSWNNEI